MHAEVITLDDGLASVQIVPQWGAAVIRYDTRVVRTGSLISILRPYTGSLQSLPNPFALASNVLLPWCNRIGGEGFFYDGRFHPMAPNLPGERFPLHGDGFMSAWTVAHCAPTELLLTLRSRTLPPFDYAAQMHCRLARGSLTMKMSITHCGDIDLPYGLGFHPWFVRAHDTELQFHGSSYWTEDEDYLPVQRLPCDVDDKAHFHQSRPLPSGWINTAYEGWDGLATLRTPSMGLQVDIQASGSLGNVMVYSPSGAADFVCVEPMSHVPNAHGLSNLSAEAGLTRLQCGQSLEGTMRLNSYCLAT